MRVRFKLHMNMICNELTADVTLVGPSLLSYLHTGQCGRMTGDVWTASAVWLSSPKASEKSRAMAVSFGPRVLATTDSGFGRGGAAWSWSCELAFKMRDESCASTWAARHQLIVDELDWQQFPVWLAWLFPSKDEGLWTKENDPHKRVALSLSTLYLVLSSDNDQ